MYDFRGKNQWFSRVGDPLPGCGVVLLDFWGTLLCLSSKSPIHVQVSSSGEAHWPQGCMEAIAVLQTESDGPPCANQPLPLDFLCQHTQWGHVRPWLCPVLKVTFALGEPRLLYPAPRSSPWHCMCPRISGAVLWLLYQSVNFSLYNAFASLFDVLGNARGLSITVWISSWFCCSLNKTAWKHLRLRAFYQSLKKQGK